MKEIDLSNRLYKFALQIVLLVRNLPKEIATYEIGKQLLKAGTSIAANYEEAIRFYFSVLTSYLIKGRQYERCIPESL
jgi:hypothetical protein